MKNVLRQCSINLLVAYESAIHDGATQRDGVLGKQREHLAMKQSQKGLVASGPYSVPRAVERV